MSKKSFTAKAAQGADPRRAFEACAVTEVLKADMTSAKGWDYNVFKTDGANGCETIGAGELESLHNRVGKVLLDSTGKAIDQVTPGMKVIVNPKIKIGRGASGLYVQEAA